MRTTRRRATACLATLSLLAISACSSGSFVPIDSDAASDVPESDSTTDAGDTRSDSSLDAVDVADGACAIDCQGGACIGGVCQPVVLAKSLNGPYGIALRGTFVYVTEFVAHGRVLRFDKVGAGQTPRVLATESALADLLKFPAYVSKPFSIAANDADVFWSDLGGLADAGFTKLFRVTTTSAAKITAYYELCAQAGVAMNDLRVFWANRATPKCLRPEQNGLFRGDLAPSGGHSGSVYFPIGADPGAPTTPGAVGLDGNRVFVGAANQLLIFDADKIDKPDGVTDALLGGSSPLSAPPYAIATDFERVMWTDYPSGGNVYSLKKNAAPETVPAALATKQVGALGVTADSPGNYVYFTNYAEGQLLRVKKDGSALPEVILAKLDHPAFLASDATTLFFTTFGSGSSDGALMRLAKP